VDDVVRRGKVHRSDATGVPDDQCRKLRRLVDGARSCWVWHTGRMAADPDYRAAVEHLTKLLSARPGRFGQAVRGVVSGHALLVNVL
jgi:hypothetical protein